MDQLNKLYKQTKLPSFLFEKKNELLHKQVLNDKDNILELVNVNKIYQNGFQAIFKTNLKVKKSEFLTLLGPSGCGKSTTLRIIAGLDQANQGDIYINGLNVTHSEPAMRNLTMVFQNYALFPHLNVYKNIAFGLNANKKKIGNTTKIWKEINFLKNKISETNWNIKNINYLQIHKNKLVRNEQKLIKFKNQKNKLIIDISNKNSLRIKNKIQKLTEKITFLEGIINFEKANILKFETIKSQLPNFKENIKILKDELFKLKKQMKVLASKEDKNIIVNERVNYAAKVLGLENYLNSKPSELSGGQRQRVALGRSIVNNPVLFLMDEPLSNLDAQLRATMRIEIRKLHEKINSGTIYVTHDQIEAMTMSDKLAVMSDGFILQIGSPKEVYKNPSCLFVAGFVGTPAMNFLEGIYVNNQFISKNGIKINLPVSKTENIQNNQTITIGIRPTDFSLDDNIFKSYKTKLKVKIINKELLGNEIQYQALIENTNDKFTFITSSYEDFSINDEIELFIILSRVHIFDTQSTVSLTSDLNLETIQALENWLDSEEKIKVRKQILENFKKHKHNSSVLKTIWNFIKNKKMKREKNEKI
ncbi:ABC transporter ATP-binding protein [Mycoplasmopsis cricetuli]|uniref:ABC transporter ATP-binding protein n=1 Tax=Mycoplasmopsis cricetuli TaxID=171283 RepID=UPI00046EE8F7|nr:ABC transporter ATP-binding protein [Mycoplasmopsis cricetuli]